MKGIYENAIQVVVWLGPAANDSDFAMNKIRSLYRTFKGKLSADTVQGLLRMILVLRGLHPELSIPGLLLLWSIYLTGHGSPEFG
jgi:hypothetical protein